MDPSEARFVEEYLDPWLSAMLSTAPMDFEEESNLDVQEPSASLSQMLSCAAFLDQMWGSPAPDSASGASCSRDMSVDPDVAPRRFGRFEIDRELGRGGFGVVFLARDPKLSREVALKIPHPTGWMNRQMRQRFLREAHAAGMLDHPHLVSIYESGEANGIGYIVSAYCAGPNLAEWLLARDSLVPISLAARLVATLANAIHHAHGRGILHRDLKPSNILLAPARDSHSSADSEFPFVPRISDFGLASFLDGRNEISRTGIPCGTLAYMAPEQAKGQREKISARTDVYALGIILYELLAGIKPFARPGMAETLTAVCTEDPPPLRRVRPDVPLDLRAICTRAIEKDPRQRYVSAAELAEDLKRFLAGQPVNARPLGPFVRLSRAARRAPAMTAFIVLATFSLLLFAVGQTVYSRKLTSALSLANVQRNRANSAKENAQKEWHRAEEERRRAELGEQQVRELLYATDMRRALESWKRNDLHSTLAILAEQVPQAGTRDQRGFEWHFLSAACNHRPLVSFSHGCPVYDCAIAPNKKLLATAAHDGHVRLWNLETGTLITTLKSHQSAVRSVAFSPDGSQLVSGGDDDRVLLWDMAAARLAKEIGKHETGVETVEWSPDGRWIVSGSRYSDLCVWSPDAGQILRIENDQRHESLTFTRDGNWLFLPTREAHVDIWDLNSRTKVQTIHTYEQVNPRAICSLRDGQWLAMSSRFREDIVIVDTVTHQLIQRLDSGCNYPQELTASPDGRWLAAAALDGGVRLFSTSRWQSDITGEMPLRVNTADRAVIAHEGIVHTACFGLNNRLATGGQDGLVHLWDIDTLAPWRNLGPTDDLFTVQSLPQRNAWITVARNADASPMICFQDGRIEACETADWKASQGVLSADQRWFAVASVSGQVGLWDLSTQKLVNQWRDSDLYMRLGRFGPSGDTLFGWSDNGDVLVWKVPSLEVIQRFPVGSLVNEVSPDGTVLASQGERNTGVAFWKVGNGSKIASIVAPQECAFLKFSSDGTLIAAGCHDARLRVWDCATGELRLESERLPHPITSVALSTDGRTALCGTMHGSIWMWHTPSRRSLGVLLQLPYADREITSVAISPDQRSVISSLSHGKEPSILLFNQ